MLTAYLHRFWWINIRCSILGSGEYWRVEKVLISEFWATRLTRPPDLRLSLAFIAIGDGRKKKVRSRGRSGGRWRRGEREGYRRGKSWRSRTRASNREDSRFSEEHDYIGLCPNSCSLSPSVFLHFPLAGLLFSENEF